MVAVVIEVVRGNPPAGVVLTGILLVFTGLTLVSLAPLLWPRGGEVRGAVPGGVSET